MKGKGICDMLQKYRIWEQWNRMGRHYVASDFERGNWMDCSCDCSDQYEYMHGSI
jgi:hypothetical protein